MKAREISDAVDRLSLATKDLSAGFQDVRKAQERFAEAFKQMLIDAMYKCALFMSSKYNTGITDPLEYIRTAPLRRVVIHWKLRFKVRKCCTHCANYQKGCPIKKMLIKGRWW